MVDPRCEVCHPACSKCQQGIGRITLLGDHQDAHGTPPLATARHIPTQRAVISCGSKCSFTWIHACSPICLARVGSFSSASSSRPNASESPIGTVSPV